MSRDEHQVARWNTRFGQFIRIFGVAALARALEVEPAAIYQWVRGYTSPRPPKARAIVSMSEHCFTCHQKAVPDCERCSAHRRCRTMPPVVVTLADIYAQRDLNVSQHAN